MPLLIRLEEEDDDIGLLLFRFLLREFQLLLPVLDGLAVGNLHPVRLTNSDAECLCSCLHLVNRVVAVSLVVMWVPSCRIAEVVAFELMGL